MLGATATARVITDALAEVCELVPVCVLSKQDKPWGHPYSSLQLCVETASSKCALAVFNHKSVPGSQFWENVSILLRLLKLLSSKDQP